MSSYSKAGSLAVGVVFHYLPLPLSIILIIIIIKIPFEINMISYSWFSMSRHLILCGKKFIWKHQWGSGESEYCLLKCYLSLRQCFSERNLPCPCTFQQLVLGLKEGHSLIGRLQTLELEQLFPQPLDSWLSTSQSNVNMDIHQHQFRFRFSTSAGLWAEATECICATVRNVCDKMLCGLA